MKHVFLILVIFAIVYVSWHLVTKRKRVKALRIGFKHGIAVAVFGAVVFALVASAVEFGSIKTL